MRRALLTALALIAAAGPGLADQGSIGIFGDPQGTNCNLTDVVPGVTSYYVVHVNTTGSTAAQYIAAKPACSTITWLADNNPFPVTLGNSQTSVSVGYGGCLGGPIHVQTILYFTMGTTPACCQYSVKCDPLGFNHCAGGLLDTVDCDFHNAVATPQSGFINANVSCHCGTPVEDTTWGHLKSLYVE